MQNENDKLKKIEEKMAQLKAQKASIVNREKEKERKDRTRRLIQKGAIAEKFFNCEGQPPEEFEATLKRIFQDEHTKDLLQSSNS